VPRCKPSYDWGCQELTPLKGEAALSSQYHRTRGKGKKTFKQDKAPEKFPKSANFSSDVHFGSHKNIERQIGDELRKLGL